nr:peptidoglycan-binding protein [Spelaeicoccus albus]
MPAIREQLIRAGSTFPGIAPADVADPENFDDHIDAAVRAFQQDRGLLVDGIVGPQTMGGLESAHWRLGDRIVRFVPAHELVGDDVRTLQTRLQSLGMLDGQIDGAFGAQTDAALRELQRDLGLDPDGVCGPETLRGVSRLGRAVTGGNPFALHERARVASSGKSLAGRVVAIEVGGLDERTGSGLVEIDVTSDIARRLEGRLTAVGVASVMTTFTAGESGSSDGEVANRIDADMFLSIRADSHPNPTASGFATFYYGRAHHSSDVSPVGHALADFIQREVVARTDLLDCRSHPRTWEVLRTVRMPAVQISTGYLTNPGDSRRLADPAFRDTMAEAILIGIQRLYLPEEDDHTTGTLKIDDVLNYRP